jgi:hypothetical protein
MTAGLLRRGRWAWLGLGCVLLVLLTVVRVSVIEPRVNVRWRDGISEAARSEAEQRYQLGNGTPIPGTASGFQYDIGDSSASYVGELIDDPAVADTGNIDREALTAPQREIRVTTRPFPFPFDDLFDRPSQLFRLHQSVWLLLAGGILLWAAGAGGESLRRNAAVATLVAVAVIEIALPIDRTLVTMGGVGDKTASRATFENYFAGRVRFEKHLSQTILLKVYERLEPNAEAPERALVMLSRGAAVWFVLCALTIGLVERWSATVLRYLALAVLAPATLLYFGWQELGYLSLNVASFPLLARGLRSGDARLEAGSALTGLGAAMHGSGLVALAGAGLAACGVSAPLRDRAARLVRLVAWGTAAYLGWIAIYIIVLKLQVMPSDQTTSWRPLFVDQIHEGRLNSALFGRTGMRDLLMEMWVAGVPLVVVALSMRRRLPQEVRMALLYMPAAILFLVFRWPFEGIGVDVDLVVAGFPAIYALAWVCAHDPKRTMVAAIILLSAHLAFWRIVLDSRYENLVIDQHAAQQR